MKTFQLTESKERNAQNAKTKIIKQINTCQYKNQIKRGW